MTTTTTTNHDTDCKVTFDRLTITDGETCTNYDAHSPDLAIALRRADLEGTDGSCEGGAVAVVLNVDGEPVSQVIVESGRAGQAREPDRGRARNHPPRAGA